MGLQERTRQRVLRILVAALLESDLTAEEMRKLTDTFSTNPSVLREIGEMLGDLLQHFQQKSTPRSNDGSQTKINGGQVYLELKRKRMSKTSAVKLMNRFSGGLISEEKLASLTLKELVDLFFTRASLSERREFARALEEGRAKDRYLDGIISRKEQVSS